jgi:hypothetical protein
MWADKLCTDSVHSRKFKDKQREKRRIASENIFHLAYENLPEEKMTQGPIIDEYAFGDNR